MKAERLEELAVILGETLDITTQEMVMFIHAQTNHRLTPAAIDKLRAKLGWKLGLAALHAWEWADRHREKKDAT